MQENNLGKNFKHATSSLKDHFTLIIISYLILVFLFLVEHTQARIVSTSPVHSSAIKIPKMVPTIRTSPCLPEEEHVPVTATELLVVVSLRIPDSAVAHEVL